MPTAPASSASCNNSPHPRRSRAASAGRSSARHRPDAQRRMADEAGGVDRRRRAVERGEIIGKAAIAVIGGVADQVERRRRRMVDRQRRQADPAIAGDDGRHPLARLCRHLRGGEQGAVVMGVHIDKAGRDDLARRHRSRARPRLCATAPTSAMRSPSIATSARNRARRCRRSPRRRAECNRSSSLRTQPSLPSSLLLQQICSESARSPLRPSPIRQLSEYTRKLAILRAVQHPDRAIREAECPNLSRHPAGRTRRAVWQVPGE